MKPKYCGGCSRTVCGKVWLKCYLEGLSEESLKLVVEKKGGSRFKFGSGDPVYSEKRVIIPALIGNKEVMIETDVISNDIPLLLSKESMKVAKTVIDFTCDSVSMLDQTVKLKYTSSGHYAVPIGFTDQKLSENDCKIILISDAAKLHIQFGHSSSDKIKKLLDDAGNTDAELVKAIYKEVENCEICQRFRKAKLHPSVESFISTRIQ